MLYKIREPAKYLQNFDSSLINNLFLFVQNSNNGFASSF